jgi:molybdate transport system substrate-binding protein
MTARIKLCTCFVLLVSGLGIGCKQPRSSAGRERARPQLHIAAAADLQFALATVAEEFHAIHPEIDVEINYGSSGNFYGQIVNGAPFDLFLSADASYPAKLLASGEAIAGSEFNYALGRIVLWAPIHSPLDPSRRGMEVLADPAIKRLAIANPDHAPYGRAAQATLTQAGLWDKLQPTLVMAESVSQAATMVRSGSADMGIIALSFALAPQMKDAGTYYLIPPETYPPLTQQGAILSHATNRSEAEQFKSFLVGPEARATLEQFGFGMPKE